MTRKPAPGEFIEFLDVIRQLKGDVAYGEGMSLEAMTRGRELLWRTWSESEAKVLLDSAAPSGNPGKVDIWTPQRKVLGKSGVWWLSRLSRPQSRCWLPRHGFLEPELHSFYVHAVRKGRLRQWLRNRVVEEGADAIIREAYPNYQLQCVPENRGALADAADDFVRRESITDADVELDLYLIGCECSEDHYRDVWSCRTIGARIIEWIPDERVWRHALDEATLLPYHYFDDGTRTPRADPEPGIRILASSVDGFRQRTWIRRDADKWSLLRRGDVDDDVTSSDEWSANGEERYVWDESSDSDVAAIAMDDVVSLMCADLESNNDGDGFVQYYEVTRAYEKFWGGCS